MGQEAPDGPPNEGQRRHGGQVIDPGPPPQIYDLGHLGEVIDPRAPSSRRMSWYTERVTHFLPKYLSPLSLVFSVCYFWCLDILINTFRIIVN